MYGNTFQASTPLVASLTLPAEPVYVALARRFGSGLLDRWGLSPDERDSAIAVLGELTANAAEHGRSQMSIGLALVQRSLRISVADFGRRPASRGLGTARGADEFGRGMDIVRVLSDRMEVRQHGDGRRVEAVLRLGAPRPGNEITPGERQRLGLIRGFHVPIGGCSSPWRMTVLLPGGGRHHRSFRATRIQPFPGAPGAPPPLPCLPPLRRIPVRPPALPWGLRRRRLSL
ncbi:ATP-binding protein [Streptomyces sp. NPDC059866]|uniref:ATP-binding protein n=1 Tax=Streptomyces sp. NPDC059866 TaxID=3346978 RepID=UPI00365E4E70